jgi:Cu/Ag efflux protein CusF
VVVCASPDKNAAGEATSQFGSGSSKVAGQEAVMKRVAIIGVVILSLLVPVACAGQAKTAPAGKKQFDFKGKVEKIDLANKTFAVKNERVQGWMEPMTMNYVPDKEDVLKRVKVGDDITAKVYDGDYRTLYDVQVVSKPSGGQKK